MNAPKKLSLLISLFLAVGLVIYAVLFEVNGIVIFIYSLLGGASILLFSKVKDQDCIFFKRILNQTD
jgi:hypothetical protein